MNEQLKKWLDRGNTYLASLTPQRRLILALLGGLIGISALTGYLVMRRDPYEVLFTELQTDDSKAVARKLSEQNIPYSLSDDNRTILVPGSQVPQARMQLAKEGLPGQDVVGFEKFDGSTLGMSSYVQRIQYVRAVQGELTRSIQRINGVKHARVHISLPPKKTFLEEEDPPKASVVLELKSNHELAKNEVFGMAHLVASAVEGLKVNQVTIVDSNGKFLHRPEDSSGPVVSSTLLEMQRAIESEYEKRIEEMLSPVVGLGKVRAKVTAEVDASRVNTTEESFDPEKVVVRQNIRNEESNQGSKPNPIGIPGSRSNLPGAETQVQSNPLATTSSDKVMQNTTNAIPRKVQITDKPSGNIKRLTVAVVVDGLYNKAADSTKETFTPRTEDELRRIQELVAGAVGYDAQRRDSITVNSMAFRTAEPVLTEEVIPGKWWERGDLLSLAIRNAFIGLLLMMFFFLVVRPFLKWANVIPQAIPEPEPQFPQTVAQFEAQSPEEIPLPLALAAPAEPVEPPDPPEKTEEAELKKRILDKLSHSPKKGARIVQDWIEENLPSPKAA